MITYGSVCSGIEAATIASQPLGWKCAWVSEIEPFPCQLLAHHYPDAPNLGDMTGVGELVAEGAAEAPDILVGGTPCFTAGHVVLTESGYIPIEDVRPGDLVMTHRGRMKKVVRVGQKRAKVGILRASGLPDCLSVTPEHPLLSVEFSSQNTRRDGKYARIYHWGNLLWTPASEMPGKQWCSLLEYSPDQHLPLSTKFNSEEAMYVAGLYLGDGHIRGWKNKKKLALVLSLNQSKMDKVRSVLGDVGTITHERTSVRLTICDTVLCEWLKAQFGKYSHLKRLPAWVLGHSGRSQLLQGYLDTDGGKTEKGIRISTTSRSLAYGSADLLNAEGYVASVSFVKTPDLCVIEGREVNQRDYYQVRGNFREHSTKSRVRHGYLLRTVKSYTPAGEDVVYNIEVEEDNSYIVNGAVVHNCQAFSIAGLRNGLDDKRGQLTLSFVLLAKIIDTVRKAHGQGPAIIVWENVPGVLSSKDNAFGCFLAGLAGELDPLVPPGGRWADAGVVLGPERTVAWRTLDAQYFGLAQRRRRVWVVASARNDFDPIEVLFEFDGMRRDTPPSRETGKSATQTITGGARRRGGQSLDDIPQVACFQQSSMKGRGTIGWDESGIAKPCKTQSDGQMIAVFGGNNTSGPIDVAPACNANRGCHNPGDFEAGALCVSRPLAFPTEMSATQVATAEDLCPALSVKHTTSVSDGRSSVRRLTPTECERLQGFPDNYTRVPIRPVPAKGQEKNRILAEAGDDRFTIKDGVVWVVAKDGPRYKALGNSWAVPCARWIFRRTTKILERRPR
jgi:site-specific DNA-cytosine methylase